MSYILEALKRSQQARDLGQVPTLDMASMPEEHRVRTARLHWPLVATGLAALAVLIALYGVMRGSPLQGDAGEGRPVAPLASVPIEPSPVASVQAQAAPLPLEPMDHQSVRQREAIPAPASGGGRAVSTPPAVPLIEPPPPRGSTAAPEPALPLRPLPPSRGLSQLPEGPIIHPSLSGHPEIDAEMERELQRQLQDEMAAMDGEDEGTGPLPTAIPADLIADIESFKDSVRKDRGLPSKKQLKREALPEGDLTKLRLTREQRADLPLFVVTVSVFDAEPKRRFVVLNGLKYREGETTDEGLGVERILPKGVVLSHNGHPFFVRP